MTELSRLPLLRLTALMGPACFLAGLLCWPLPTVSGQSPDPDPPVEPAEVRPAATLEEIRAQFPAEETAPADQDETLLSDDKGTELGEAELTTLLDSLGAAEFAVRERAAGRLRSLGPGLLPALRQRAKQSPDPEIQMRAGELVEQISRTDLEQRVTAFLDGADVRFEGWEVARGIFGDSANSRELFVEIREAHPDLVLALAGTPRRRQEALEEVMLKVQREMFEERELPTRADVIAMLLPANDLNVPLSKPVETLVLRALGLPSAREVLNDPHVGPTAAQLLVGYFERTSPTVRADVLWFAMELEVEESLPIAVETLEQTDEPRILVSALQAIAQFGSKGELSAVKPLFGNQQVVTERGVALDDREQTTTVGDAALATAAILLEVPMTEVGFPASAKHARFGFLPDDIGLDVEAEEEREAIREEIEGRMEGDE